MKNSDTEYRQNLHAFQAYLYRHWIQSCTIIFFTSVGVLQSLHDLEFFISNLLGFQPQARHMDYFFALIYSGGLTFVYRYGYEKKLDKAAKEAAQKLTDAR